MGQQYLVVIHVTCFLLIHYMWYMLQYLLKYILCKTYQLYMYLQQVDMTDLNVLKHQRRLIQTATNGFH